MDAIAGSATASHAPDNLIAGSDGIMTDSATLLSGQNLTRKQVVGRVTATRKLIECAPGAIDGSQIPVGVLAHDCDASAADKTCQFYKGAKLRLSEVIWHANFTTDAQKKAAFDRTPITIV